MSPIIPTNPMDLPTTQALIAERIQNGEITQADVDLLKKGYRGMATAAFLGSLVGVPVYITLSRRRPPPAMVTRLVAAAFMSSTGSFLGFTIGGAAAAMEVSTHMQDSQRKLKVFEEIMITSKRAAERQGTFGRPSSSAGVPVNEAPFDEPRSTGGGAVWDAEASERRQEAERERDLSPSAEGGIAAQTGTTWDRLRKQNTSRSSPQQHQRQQTDISSLPTARPSNPLDLNTSTTSKYAPGMSVEQKIEAEAAEERRREQEEFERLLERERTVAAAGVNGGEIEVGKWR